MGKFSKVLLAIDKAHTVLQRTLDYGPGLGGLTIAKACRTMWIPM